jgi:hypothetical protein
MFLVDYVMFLVDYVMFLVDFYICLHLLFKYNYICNLMPCSLIICFPCNTKKK